MPVDQVVTAAAVGVGRERRFAVLLKRSGVVVFGNGQWKELGIPDGISVRDLEAFGSEFWLATDQGLYQMTDDSDRLSFLKVGGERRAILALSRSSRKDSSSASRMWVLGHNWIGVWENEDLRPVHEDLDLHTFERPNKSPVICADAGNGLYFDRGTHLTYLDLETEKATPIGREDELKVSGPSDLLLDRNGQVWIAGWRGLSSISSRRLESYTSIQGLIADEVSSVIELSRGRILLGQESGFAVLEEGGIQTFDFGGRSLENYLGGRVMELVSSPNDTVWAAVSRVGLLNLSTTPTISIISSQPATQGLISSVQIDADGGIWTIEGSRLYRRTPDGNLLNEVILDRPSPGARRIVLGSHDLIFVPTKDGLVYGSVGNWKRVRAVEGRASNNIYSLWVLDNARAWVGTSAGLFEFRQGELRRAFLDAMTIDRPVYAVMVDTDSRLWCGTDDGMYVWDGISLRHLTTRHGLAGAEVNRAALISDMNGDVWIGTDSGVTHYHRRHDRKPLVAPTVELKEIEANGTRFPSDEPLHLARGVNDLNFSFRIISLNQEESPHVQCFLEGYDQHWSPSRDHGGSEYRYTNLPPGRYRFLVRTGWENGSWSEAAASGEVVVPQPLWLSRGFLLAVAGTSVFLTLAAVIAFRRRSHLRSHDPLTGLGNRRLFYNKLERAFAQAEVRGEHSVAVLILDLDRFKTVTQSLGQQAGESLLKEVASRLRKVGGASKVLARLETNDFAILLTGVNDAEQAMDAARKYHAAFSAPIVLNGQEVFPSASIGVAVGGKDYRWGTNLLRDADIALQQARAGGLGQIVLFDSSMRHRVYDQLRLETDLRHALERNEFELVFQPIVALDDLEVIAVEALLRWRHLVSGLLQPAEFLVAAEQAGLIVEIGGWVIEEGLRLMERWRGGVFAGRSIPLHVNLSPKQFEPGDLPLRVTRALRKVGLEGSSLVLEITENFLTEPTARVLEQTRALRAEGVRLSIDDFGAGFSSLGSLKDLPVDQIKLDRSFIARSTPGRGLHKIVGTVLTLGANLGLQVVVEGVEHSWQHDWLRELGCEAGQGFLYSRPLPIEAFEAAVSSKDLVDSLDSTASA